MSFAEYFRTLRMQRGVGLREFCAEHGFDPGNVSRMTAGKALPPRSDDVLDRYAAALGLERNSAEYLRFFDLAAAERGELPPDLRANTAVREALPAVFESLRRDAVSFKARGES